FSFPQPFYSPSPRLRSLHMATRNSGPSSSATIRAAKFMVASGIGFVEAVELTQAPRGGSEYTAQVVLGNAVASCEHPLVVKPGYEVMLIEDKRFNRDAL